LIWSQSLLVLMSYRVRLVAGQASLQRRSRDAVRLAGLALAFVNTRIEIADSGLYSELATIHIERVVIELCRVKLGVAVLVGWPKTIVAENYTVSVQSMPMFSQCRCNTTSWPHKDKAASPPTIAIITGV
jgi:hypothetical protein